MPEERAGFSQEVEVLGEEGEMKGEMREERKAGRVLGGGLGMRTEEMWRG